MKVKSDFFKGKFLKKMEEIGTLKNQYIAEPVLTQARMAGAKNKPAIQRIFELAQFLLSLISLQALKNLGQQFQWFKSGEVNYKNNLKLGSARKNFFGDSSFFSSVGPISPFAWINRTYFFLL
jgi:hypothetical protein